MGAYAVDRSQVGRGEAEHRQICPFPWFQRADKVVDAQRLRCIAGGHLESPPGRNYRGIARAALVNESSQVHLLEHVQVVV